MEKIIENLVKDLMHQRKELVDEIKLIDENNMNFHNKQTLIQDAVNIIDAQIYNHLERLSTFE